MKVVFLASQPKEAASVRFRVLQYLPLLQERGIVCAFRPFFTSSEYRVLYQEGRRLHKAWLLLRGGLRRLRHWWQARRYEVLVIHREAFPVFQAFYVKLLRLWRRPIVTDFDDALFLVPEGGRRLVTWFRPSGDFDRVLQLSDAVLAGNAYLCQYAARWQARSYCLPTVVDTTLFHQPDGRASQEEPPVIGWIGSHTTTPYLERLLPVLSELASRCAFRLRIVGAARPFEVPGVVVENRPWELALEVEEIQSFDIGVYPVPDSPWGHGKCGFKTIQYFACGVPVVASPVGVNREIIQHEVNGLFAATPQEWIEALERLIRDKALRQRLGEAGRKTVEERFSLAGHAQWLADLLRSIGDGLAGAR